MEAAATAQKPPEKEDVSSFSKSLLLGEIHEDLVFPFPKPDPAEQDKIRGLIAALREMPYDAGKVEEDRWIGDETIHELGERGLMGLYVPEEYGGQGLSQTGSWRLDGVKHYIGNGSKAGVLVTFAKTGENEYTAFILEGGMEGLEVGHRFDTMGLRGNDLRELHYNGIRVPPENVLGERARAS